jgi:transposase
MFLYKTCPRCRGDLNLTLEKELVCLQCGHEVPRQAAEALVKEYVAARSVHQVPAATVRRAA